MNCVIRILLYTSPYFIRVDLNAMYNLLFIKTLLETEEIIFVWQERVGEFIGPKKKKK